MGRWIGIALVTEAGGVNIERLGPKRCQDVVLICFFVIFLHPWRNKY